MDSAAQIQPEPFRHTIDFGNDGFVNKITVEKIFNCPIGTTPEKLRITCHGNFGTVLDIKNMCISPGTAFVTPVAIPYGLVIRYWEPDKAVPSLKLISWDEFARISCDNIAIPSSVRSIIDVNSKGAVLVGDLQGVRRINWIDRVNKTLRDNPETRYIDDYRG